MSLPAFPPHLTQMSEFIGQSILEKQRSDSSLIPFSAPTDKELQGEKIAAALGTFMAQAPNIWVALEHGYYWNPKEQKIVVNHGSPVIGAEPKLTRNERRKLNRIASKEKERIHKEEKERWKALRNHIDHLHYCRNVKAKAADLIFPRTETGSGIANGLLELESNISTEIADCLCRFGTNAILRFFIWIIREIGEEVAKDPVLRKKYLTTETAFTRDRDISLSDVFLFLLTMAGMNMNSEVYEYFKNRSVHPSTSAMIQRRKLLKAEGVEYLFRRITDICTAICDHLPRNNQSLGCMSRFQNIFACDGSGVNVCLNSEDKATYIQDSEGIKGYNQYHLNSIREGIRGLFVSNVLQGGNFVNETRAAVDMIRGLTIKGPSLFSGDRGYGSLNLIETIRRKENLEALFRVKESWITETKELPLQELDVMITVHIVTTQRKQDKERFKNGTAKYMSGTSKFGKNKKSQTWDYASEVDVTFRVVRFQLDGGAWETLVTTLDSSEYSIADLKELYFMRWRNIENGFRVLKWDNHLSQMHSKLDNSARQEIFARLAMHNLVSCIIGIANAAEPALNEIHAIETDHENENHSAAKQARHPMNINRRFATYLLCDFLKNPDTIGFDVLEMMLRYKTPVRKGRRFKRDLRTIAFQSHFYR